MERSFHTLIIGSGAAGFSCALRLAQFGMTDLALVTEGVSMGTSRNTGSDKQTYYKLTLSGGDGDSVLEMAQTLFEGQAVDGDLALCEAAESVPCFLELARLGVPFPTNRYGEYIGYKTDHDPRRRATSAGPLTSKLMTEALEKAFHEKGLLLLDHLQLVKILTDQSRVYGAVCLDTETGGFSVLRCRNLVLATGGPACLYADSVYPASQHGASGLAFEAGVRGRNLTEWQYGMASVAPRWNVSGSYMQVLPKLVSTNVDGSGEREFLPDAFSSEAEMLSELFLKGYQWPFDTRKALSGSSRIDLLVYQEHVLRGRRIFLDYRSNPQDRPIPWDALSAEAREYLQKSGAVGETPIERLAVLNQPAIDFYRSHGVDLYTDRLEIAVCAQHNNGGLAIDAWWRTNIEGVFAIGEAAGSHGVYRPGGTALNAGQVGALRAAKWIAAHADDSQFLPETAAIREQIDAIYSLAAALTRSGTTSSASDNTAALTHAFRQKMSACGGAFRNAEKIRKLQNEAEELLAHFAQHVRCQASPRALGNAFYLRDQLLCTSVYLSAMADFSETVGCSRGSALYTNPAGSLPQFTVPELSVPELFRFLPDPGRSADQIQEISREDALPGPQNRTVWRAVHPLPDTSEEVFENVWRSYRINRNIE